jgi:hypothetical protein
MPSRIVFVLLSLVAGCTAQAGSFRAYHPDQYYFGLAMEAHEAQRYEESRERFRQAARYADKPAQLALAIMARDGIGGAADLAEAYAWADLASERGYSAFLLQRERIWEQLDAAQRERALARGAQLYAEYGDAVAKPRLERLLRAGYARKTGSRAGGDTSRLGVIDLSDPAARAGFIAAFMTNPGKGFDQFASGVGAAGRIGLGSASYYNESNWRPEEYWAARDSVWLRGRVEVQPLRKADDAAAGRG